jgi:hypothetical protein
LGRRRFVKLWSSALSYGRPIVGTSQAFRGIDSEAGDFIIRDEPRAFADAVLDLITSGEERRQAAENSRRLAARANDVTHYFRSIRAQISGGGSGGQRRERALAAIETVIWQLVNTGVLPGEALAEELERYATFSEEAGRAVRAPAACRT